MPEPVSKTQLNLWMAFVDEAKTQRLYAAYASQAMREGHPEVAEAFMEAAGAEEVHALAALGALGEVKSTAENLRRVIEEEAQETRLKYPRYIEEARQEGRQDALRVFGLALEREQAHVELFQRALDRLEKKAPGKIPEPPQQAQAAGGAAVLPPHEHAPRMPMPTTPETETATMQEERERIEARSRIRELVFGAQDGVLTAVAVVSGFFGAHATNANIIFAGLASGFAGMVAMTAGSYVSSKAESEVQRAEFRREMRELRDRPGEEIAELIEMYRYQGMGEEQARDAALRVAQDPQAMLEVMAREELGIDVQSRRNPVKDAVVMALSFAAGAVLPIVPYVFLHGLPALVTSVLLAVAALFGVGVIRARVAETNWFWTGLETFGIGATAAILGYVLGSLIPLKLGVNLGGGG